MNYYPVHDIEYDDECMCPACYDEYKRENVYDE